MAAKKWLLPTNTANLGMMIAQGLICEPEGFSKYYTDILNEKAGYIPVLFDKEQKQLISQALTEATREDDSLTTCIIEINLNNIVDGTVYSGEGEYIEISELKNENLSIDKLFIPAPLPLSCISRVLFSSLDQKNKFINDAKTIYRNVPLDSFKMEAPKNMAKHFLPVKDADLLQSSNNQEVRLPDISKINYKKTYALGGLLSALFYFSKNGKLSDSIFHNTCIPSNTSHADIYDYPLIYNYFYPVDSPSKDNDLVSDPTNRMFQNILDIVINKDASNCNNSIIEFLQSDGLSSDDGFRERASKLAKELMEFHRNISDKPISEIFQQSKTPEGKSSIKLILLMLFHRKDVEALTDFQLDVFEEEDYLLLAMLFGMRDKFIKLPKFLKEYAGLQLYISNLMAAYLHESAKTGVTFKKIKSPPTIINMLKPNKLEFISWASKLKEINIQGCFNSVMPNKVYKNNKGISTYEGIVLPKIEIDEARYFTEMTKIKVDSLLYNKISTKYKKS